MNIDQIEKIKTLEQLLPEAPWSVSANTIGYDSPPARRIKDASGEEIPLDYRHIAEIRNALPKLLDEIKKLQKEKMMAENGLTQPLFI